LSRASQKEALQAATDAQRALSALDNAALAAIEATLPDLHRPVRLQGTLAARAQVYLDNRQMQGKPGFYVMTPLRLDGSDVGGGGAARLGATQFCGPRAACPRSRLPMASVQIDGRIAAVAAATL
jgi:surfeit locus 1 family protein